MDISTIDPNFATVTVKDEDDVKWISAHDERMSLYGVYYDKDEGLYMRMPVDIAMAANEKLGWAVIMTTGGRLRFVTDSPYIVIKASLPAFAPMPHMTIRGSHGFGVYADGFFENSYSPNFKDFLSVGQDSPLKQRIYFAQKNTLFHKNTTRGENHKSIIDVYFPLYGGVAELYLGVAQGSVIEKAPEYEIKKPLVFYGSSITQGACASHPGNDYTAMIARRLNADYINLGFSGNGNAEAPMIDYINGIDGSLFAFDYNMYEKFPDRVLPPHYSIYERIREKHPGVPILMYDKPASDYTFYQKREDTIRETYERAVSEGDELVAFVSAHELFGEGDRDACTVDASHPTDFGAVRITEALFPVIKALLDKANKQLNLKINRNKNV